MISYDTHVVVGPFSKRNANGATTGSSSITISGLNFEIEYSTLSARAGVTTCEASMWQSDSIVTCRLPSGVHLREPGELIQKDSQMAVTMAAFTASTRSDIFSYDMPSISSGPSPSNAAIYPSIAVWVMGQLQGAGPGQKGRTLLTITGSNFGIAFYTLQVCASIIYAHTCKQTHTRAHTHAHTYNHMHRHTQTHTHVNTHVQVYTHVHTYTHFAYI